MADVRLTATNPDDSTVVPVACNAKGELKLEELPDQSFDGNLDGDLTVSGSATSTSSSVFSDVNDTTSEKTGFIIQAGGSGVNFPNAQFRLGRYTGGTASANSSLKLYLRSGAEGLDAMTPAAAFNADGSATFAGDAFIGDSPTTAKTPGQRLTVTEDGIRLYLGAQGGAGTIPGAQIKTNFGSSFNGSLNYITQGGSVYTGAHHFFTGDSGSNTRKLAIWKNGDVHIGGTIEALKSASSPNITLKADGSAMFAGDVVVGSRNKKWMIVESNGLAHLVEQTRAAGINTADLAGTSYPPLRDIPGELTMVEQQLQKVLEKLRMIPEAGWEVWDGSD